jgi:hypothetical protein
MSSCSRRRSPWETFLDGELPAPQMLELQAHLDGCLECSGEVAFSQAVRASTREVVLREESAQLAEAGEQLDERGVSAAFSTRLSSALAREAELERREHSAQRTRRTLREWAPRAGALAVSAAAAVVLWQRSNDNVEPTTDVGGKVASRGQSGSSTEPEEMLDRLLDLHLAPPEPQVTRPELVQQLEPFVGVRMPTRTNLAQYGALWQGGSVVKVRDDRQLAYFRYRTTDDHKVTVYVYNPARIPLHHSLEQRMVREQPVYEGYRRGYMIVAQTRRGVGYAVTTDLDEPSSVELMQAISNSAVNQ